MPQLTFPFLRRQLFLRPVLEAVVQTRLTVGRIVLAASAVSLNGENEKGFNMKGNQRPIGSFPVRI